MVAENMGLSPENFTKDDYEQIARGFIKGFEWANEDWADILEDSIK